MKYTTNVKRQHTVPKFLLKNFGFGRKENKKKLFTFDKKNEREFQQSVNDATVRNAFYNFVDDPKQLSLESFLEKIESHSSVIINEIVKSKSLSTLNQEKKEMLSIFVLSQYFRTYGHFKMQESMIESVASKIRNMGFDPNDVKNLKYNDFANLKNSFLSMIPRCIEQKQYISTKNWHLFETDKDNPFFISDHPVVLHNEIDLRPYGNLGLAVKGIQVYLPLSSTLILGMLCPSYLIDLKESKENAIWLLQNTLVDEQTMKNIDSICKNIENFTTNKSIKLTCENVKFYNSLQVSFSEQYIYSEKNDFPLIKEMISDNEKYKEGFRFTS